MTCTKADAEKIIAGAKERLERLQEKDTPNDKDETIMEALEHIIDACEELIDASV